MENSFAIVCDVTCDLNAELRAEYGIEYVAGTITFPDGKEERSFLDWSECKHIPDCTSEAFYTLLKKDPDAFKSAPANIDEFAEAFEKHVKEGKPVLAIAISSALSGTYAFMCGAKKQLLEKYPDAKITVIDSKRYAGGMGLLCIHASMLRKEGKSFEEVAAYIEENKIRFHQAGWLDDLFFVAKKGRMTNAKAFFGNLIGIKPIGELDSNGLTTVIGKVKGEKAAFGVCLKYMEALGDNLKDQIILIAQSNRPKQAAAYKQMIEEKFSPKAVYICDVFPPTGINVGPGLMVAFFMGKPISEGLVEEKALIAQFTQK